MINLPCNTGPMSQVTPCQNVPVQTSQYNFPTYQQRQTGPQQMQTTACGPYSGVSQGPFGVCQPDYMYTQQCTSGTSQPVTTNPCQPPVFPGTYNPAPVPPASCGQLPQNILDQIRACVSNAAPIFILPGGCQQPSQQPMPVPPQAMIPPTSPMTYPPSGLTYPAACYPPPPFYPYPVPLPFCDSFMRCRDTVRDDCGCCRKRDIDAEMRGIAHLGCRYDAVGELAAEHRCTLTTDDTICSKRNCPSSLHLQALASQFLSLQGVIPCAATRLVLRKVAGSNVTTTMEDTMMKAQKAINALTKDQLLAESRNAQQVNALINLHMTANPPPVVIPVLTLVQLKVNLLKAQVEALVNQKLMEIQGVGVEVDTELIDPAVLALKSDAELRDFLTVLRQRECDERVNVNFAPYRSQRVIAETRLNNIQIKLRQVEAEFDRRRCAMLPAPTLSSRVVQQFSTPCYSRRFDDPRRLTIPSDIPRSPDPFVCTKPRSPKRLLLKPCTRKPETPAQTAPPPTRANPSPQKTTVDHDDRSKEKDPSRSPEQQRSDTDNCTCYERTSSEDSSDEDKKKLRPSIAQIDTAVTSNVVECREALTMLTPSVCVRIVTERRTGMDEMRKCERSNEMSDFQGTPCNAWIDMEHANVTTDVESTRNFAEASLTENDTIALGERIDEDVCESRDEIADREESANQPNIQQSEEKEIQAIPTNVDESTKTRDVEITSSRDALPPEIEQQEATTIETAAEVADTISSAQEAQNPMDEVHSSSLRIAESSKKRYEDEREERNGETSPLIAGETARSANEVEAIEKSKKKTRFQIVSLTNIGNSHEYLNKQAIGNETAKNSEEMDVPTDLDVKKLDERSSMRNLGKNAVALDIGEKRRPEDASPDRLALPKRCADRLCQTAPELAEEDEKASTLSSTNVLPPMLKHLRKRATNKKRKLGTHPGPLMKVGFMAAKWDEATSETLRDKNDIMMSDHADLEHEQGFVSDIISLVSNVATFVNKVVTLNGRLIHPNDNATLHTNLSANNPREYAPMRDDPQMIKNHDSLALHHLGSEQQRSNSDPRDANFRSRISTGEGCGRIDEVKHLIIEDKRNNARYLLVGTPSTNDDLIRNFGSPYKVQKSLLIRSRLKNSANSQDHPCPFSLVKRARKETPDEQTKREKNIRIMARQNALRSSERFWILPKVMTADGSNGGVSETRERGGELIEEISRERSHDDTTMSEDNRSAQERRLIDNFAANNELVTNVHDYLASKSESNTSVYKFSKLQIYGKTHEAHFH